MGCGEELKERRPNGTICFAKTFALNGARGAIEVRKTKKGKIPGEAIYKGGKEPRSKKKERSDRGCTTIVNLEGPRTTAIDSQDDRRVPERRDIRELSQKQTGLL